MKRIYLVAVALLLTACQLKGGDPVVTTQGRVPIPATSRDVTLRWAASTGTVQGYKVEASLDGTNFKEVMIVAPAYSGVVITLGLDATYYFRVRSFNQGGNSAYSPVTTITL